MSTSGKNMSYLYTLLAITFWGVSFVSTKTVLLVIHPFTLIAVRFAMGSIFLLVLLLLLKEKLAFQMRHLPHFLLLSFIGIFVHQLIQATALQVTDATTTGWLITLSPIFTAILSILFLKERLSIPKLAGIAIAIVGVLLLTSRGHLGSLSAFSANWGNILIIISTVNWAIYSIILKKMSLPYSSLKVTFYTSTLGFMMVMPFFLWSHGWEQIPNLSVSGWIHMVFLGLFVTALGYLFWGKALEVLDATQVSVFLYLEPLATVVAAMILLHESLLLSTFAGGLLIILGVAVVNGQVRLRKSGERKTMV